MTSSPTLLNDSRTRWLAVGAMIGLGVAIAAGPLLTPGRTVRAVDPITGSAVPDHTISVNASGRVTIRPDLADVRIGVSITAPTAAAARDEAAEAMARVIAALKAAGIADRDLQTSTLSLQPVYDYSSSAPKLTGYAMASVVAATLRDVESVGAVVDAAVAAGATTVDSITFRVEDPTTAENAARKLAMADARRRAEALASEAGVSIVGVASISESSSDPTPPVFYGRDMVVGASAPTQVEVGTNEVSISVAVAYLID